MTKKQAESTLTQVVLASWNRLRSPEELDSFITRRELALAEVEVDF